MEMKPGDIFAVISDGIFEAPDPHGELFGADRVMKIIADGHADTPTDIIRAIRAAVDKYTRGAPAADDRTGIVIKALV